MFRKLERLPVYNKLAKAKNHWTFIHKCKDLNIIPNFVCSKNKHYSFQKQKLMFYVVIDVTQRTSAYCTSHKLTSEASVAQQWKNGIWPAYALTRSCMHNDGKTESGYKCSKFGVCRFIRTMILCLKSVSPYERSRPTPADLCQTWTVPRSSGTQEWPTANDLGMIWSSEWCACDFRLKS